MSNTDDLIELVYPNIEDERKYAPVGGLVGELDVKPDNYKSSPRSISGASTDIGIKLPKQETINKEPGCCERTAQKLDRAIESLGNDVTCNPKKWTKDDWESFIIISVAALIFIGMFIGGFILVYKYHTDFKYDCNNPVDACSAYEEDDISEDDIINCFADTFPICGGCTGCLRFKFGQTLCVPTNCAGEVKTKKEGYKVGGGIMLAFSSGVVIAIVMYVISFVIYIILRLIRCFFCY